MESKKLLVSLLLGVVSLTPVVGGCQIGGGAGAVVSVSLTSLDNRVLV
ncbi:MAG: hypothetical protein K0S08_2180 [Gammaproteobacteria bacterium]|jgi:hypothetical protein|nr:hypothetical protein [Gammaproteobacteria bacterium]